MRFDYGGGTSGLGDAMRRSEAQPIADAIATAARLAPRMPEPIAPDAPLEEAAPAAPVEAPLPALTTGSALALVAANLYPLLGVWLLDWDLASIMVLYWAESAIIAFYTVLKIAVVGKLVAIVAAPFFIGHFGAFMSAHFLFIDALFLRATAGGAAGDVGAQLSAIFHPIWTSIAALWASHGVSFVSNFLGRGEYAGASVRALMHAPCRRVAVMHLTLILGGWIVLVFGMPDGALALLLVLKTAVDLRAHRKEHARAGGA